jgi:transposase
MTKRETQVYESEFKERAVKLAVESTSQAQVARELGISKNTLYSWIRQYHQGSKASKAVNDEHVFDENKRLRKENARLKEERDILKKAAAYFAVSSR